MQTASYGGPGSLGKHRVYVVQGDITQLSAHILVYSTDSRGTAGHLWESFSRHVSGFDQSWRQAEEEWFFVPRRVGETYWLPLPSERLSSKPGGVVVAVVTGLPALESVPADVEDASTYIAARHALRMAIEQGHKHFAEQRLLIAIPALRVGTGGADRKRLQAARSQLRAIRDELGCLTPQWPPVDVAVVTYTATSYQVLLTARRIEFAELANPIVMPGLPELTEAIQRGRCVLFVGSGLSAGTELPSWTNLIDTLAAELGLSMTAQNKDLDFFLDLAQFYREERPEQLEALISQKFLSESVGAQPTIAHYLLTSLPFKVIVTTNYDDLLERALRALKRYPISVTTDSDVSQVVGSGTHVVKLHGDAMTPAAGFVLSRDDYDEFFTRRPAMAALLEGLLLNHTFFFVGYSLRDPNFRQIYNRIALMLGEAKRPAYATTFDTENGHLTAAGWRSKKVQLIVIPGTSEDQPHNLLAFLDTLAELVSGAQRLFLMSDGSDGGYREFTSHNSETGTQNLLGPLKTALWEAGRLALEISQQHLTARQAEEVARVIEFLTLAGWKPELDHDFASDARLEAWERLANLVDDLEIRQRILVTALAETQNTDQSQRILDQLKKL